MTAPRSSLGAWGEKLAAEHLRQNGYHILEMNYRCPHGEIDIVAQDGPAIVFVEVRTRRGSAHGTPGESITPAKRRKLIEASQAYLQEHQIGGAIWRIDVVAISLYGGRRRIDLIRSAVEG